MTRRTIFYVAAAYGTAAFTGAMLTIGLVLGAFWKSLPPAEFLDWFAANSSLIGRVIPLFVIPAVVGLAGAAVCDRGSPQRPLWMAALMCMAGILAITFAFHLPMNNVFNAKAISPSGVGAMLDRWLWLHGLRIALGLAASVLSILAIHSGSARGKNAHEGMLTI